MVMVMAKISGRNPVIECLEGKREIHKIYLQYGISGKTIAKIIRKAEKNNIKIERLTEKELSDMAEIDNHQGVVAVAEELEIQDLDNYLERFTFENGFIQEKPRFLILDQVQDPHNFGAIIRTAQAALFDAVIFPEKRSAPVTAAVIKTSAGAVEHIPLIKVKNLNRAISKLKDIGVWIAGADIEGRDIYFKADLTGALGLVIGNEGSGIRRLVKENCDFLLSIPVAAKPGSLNASVAAGILIYETVRQRKINLD